jgi:hypothetical protein
MSNNTNNGWPIAVISSITLSIISSAIYDFIKSKPFLSSLFSFFKFIWNFTIRILESEIKLWWIILIIILYKIIGLFIRKYKKDKVPETAKYSDYKRERFKNWIWKWDWKWNGERWRISNLYPYCPNCDIELLNKSDILHQKIVCPRCNAQFTDYDHNIDDTEGVKAMIYDNVKKENY